MVFAKMETIMINIHFYPTVTCSIDNVGCARVVRENGFLFVSKNGKDSMTFVFVKRGEMKYFFDDKTVTVPQGCGIFVPKELPYKAVYLGDSTTILVLSFNLTSNVDISFLSEVSFQNTRAYRDIFNSVTMENIRNTFFLLAKAYELIDLMSRQSSMVPKEYIKITPALNEITNNYYENHSVSYYASKCGMKESNFRRLFKEYTGKSPIEYRNEIRICEAKKLINSGECSVQEAAYLVGFNNMSFFYEVYRKFNGKQ